MQDIKIVWEPLPGSQVLAMSCPAHIILYHGTRGPGKTDTQLMRFRARVGQGYGRHWRGIIFDREYKNLDDLVSKSMRYFPEFHDGAKFMSSKADYRWVWPTGEELLFRAIRRETDYWGYHGQEFPYIGWNELTKYPNGNMFESLMSCNRSSFRPQDHPLTIDGDRYKRTGEIVVIGDDDKRAIEYLLPEIPLEVFATCNPYGAGHNWVKKRFISPAPMGQIVRKSINVFNPRTQKQEDVVKTSVHIFGSYKENKYLSPEYVAELESITDPNKKKAWLDGNWDVVSGGMFDDVWDPSQNILQRFEIPPSWKIDRSYDHGSAKPFSVGWWAESDGSDYFSRDGVRHSTVRGDLFRIGEWYGTNGKTNTGLNLLAADIAKGIVERQLAMGIYKRVVPGPADNSINDDVEGKSIAKAMYEKIKLNGNTYNGIGWTKSNKSSGSRKQGWEALRAMMKQAHREFILDANGERVYAPREKPGLFVFDTCRYFIELVPILPRDEDDQDDADTDSEDHIGDETRYRIYKVNAAKTIDMGYAK